MGEIRKDHTFRPGSDGFHIKNEAIINENPTPGHGKGWFVNCNLNAGETAIIENCYFYGAKGDAGIYVHPNHEGKLIIRNCWIEHVGSDGIYAETQTPHGNGGEIIVENCYLKDLNVAAIRIGNGEVRNTVIDNTGDVPPTASGATAPRGIWNHYEGNQNVLIENCDIQTPAVAVWGQGGSRLEVKDSQVQGGIRGNVDTNNVGSSPDLSAPSGVPASPEEAVNEDIEPSPPDQEEPEGTVFALIAGDDTSDVEYSFTVNGEVSRNTEGRNSAEDNDSISENEEGTYTVEGVAGNGYGDSFFIDGEVTSLEYNPDDWTLRWDGEEVSKEDLVGEDDSDDGDNQPDEDDNPVEEITLNVEVSGTIDVDGELDVDIEDP